MNDYYVEVLIRRNVEHEKKKRKVIAFVVMILMLIGWLVTRFLVFFAGFALSFLGYYFLVRKFSIEFEYFYMDGELTISKIVNKSRRKKILELSEGEIKLIAPVNSAEIESFNNLEKKDYTANEATDITYAVVYMDKVLKRVDIQMNDELYKEFKRNMPYKIKNY